MSHLHRGLGLLLLATLGAKGQPMSDPLQTLRAGHPRLILLDDDLPRLRSLVAADNLAGQWREQLLRDARGLLDKPPTEFKIIGPRLLSASRQVLDRVYRLGLIYRLEGDVACGRRAVAELLAAAAWPHWNPRHFLDTAELNHAFGIGYDWLQPLLTAEERATIKAALLTKGLTEAKKAYEAAVGWTKSPANWNQVCNGGNSIGALALADEEPELARYILTQAIASLPRAMRSYGPDGGWAEGPGYWHYATRYNVYVLAAMETALGTDFELSKIQGFAEAGDFRIYFAGPIRRSFNYADAGDGVESAEELFWLAKRFNKPVYAAVQRQTRAVSALDLIWYSPEGRTPKELGFPLDRWFKGVDVTFLRGDWDDPRTTWIGFKGGDNQANHSHLDLGTFVLDALGQRWFFEFGRDDYNLPGYFGAQRWNYYRLNTFGQNTLVIDNQNQVPSAKAKTVAFHSTPERAWGVVDLSQAYKMCRSVRRGVALLGRRDVLMVDEVTADQPVLVEWGAHTDAKVTVDGPRATLTKGGETFHARILAPAGAVFEARDCLQEPPQARNEGITKLVARPADKVTGTRLAILLTPAADAPAPAVGTLAEWLAAAR